MRASSYLGYFSDPALSCLPATSFVASATQVFLCAAVTMHCDTMRLADSSCNPAQQERRAKSANVRAGPTMGWISRYSQTLKF